MALEWWWVAIGANTIMVVAYAWLSYVMFRGLQDGHQWRSNPIATATFAIFVTCTVGHAFHIFHAFEPWLLARGAPTWLGLDAQTGAAAQVAMSDPLVWTWELATATVAIWYLSMRRHLEVVHGGAALCADMAARQARAETIHHDVREGLERAQALIRAGRRKEALAEVDRTLAASKGIITSLLGERGKMNAFGPGDLRRAAPPAG